MSGDLVIRRADTRAETTLPWLHSRHSFSFGDHYDPANTHHGALLVHNDETVAPQQGFDTHAHRDMEIVTWVRSGSLVHHDSAGHTGVVYPRLAQRMSAGAGIEHSERNDTYGAAPGTAPVRFIQMWVMPDEPGGAPSYDQHELGAELDSGDWVALASGVPRRDSAIRIGNSGATLWVARPQPGRPLQLPESRYGHLFVVDGALTLDGAELVSGDAARLTNRGGDVGATTPDTEVLFWEMHRGLYA